MGQKVNCTALRLGLQSKYWKSNWWTSSKENYGFLLFEDNKIRKLIDGFFRKHGFFTTDIKILRDHKTIKISTKIYLINNDTEIDLDFQKNCYKNLKNNLTFGLKTNINLKIELLPTSGLIIKNFDENLIYDEKLSRFLERSVRKLSRKDSFRMFKRNPLYRKTIEIILLSIASPGGSILLAKYLAYCLENTRRHGIVISFIQRLFQSLSKEGFLNIEGLYIKIRGRINGSDRRKQRKLNIGALPLQKMTALIDYNLQESFTVYGVFGVKVWICYKR